MDRRTFLAGAPGLLALSPVPGDRRREAPRAAPTRRSMLPQDPADIPALPREFRGLWVATVGNIDWPSRAGLPAERQQQEMRDLLDRARALRFNAIVFQVRPCCDALYASEREPWSEYLTGAMGRSPGYDPLEFTVREAHARGLEVHAWFNPYRARPAGADSPADPLHVSKAKPSLVRRYGKMQWLDPGEPAVQQHSLEVILDVVRRYEIDGIHLDDYFYPYKEKNPKTGQELPFPDEPSFKRYRAAGGNLGRDDWRRSNVDTFIERLYREVKAARREVRVGISPFGIWRPGYPSQIKGFDAFAQLYADSRRWLMEGWLDYFSPQLYWKIEQPGQSFAVLLMWWSMQNPQGRHLWPGVYTSKYSPVEIEYQTRVTRGLSGAGGNVHFSAKSLLAGDPSNPKTLAGHLAATVYNEYALAPASPWLGDTPPPAPTDVHLTAEGLTWQAASGVAPFVYAVQWYDRDRWRHVVVPGAQASYPLPESVSVAAVSTVDRLGNASPPTRVER